MVWLTVELHPLTHLELLEVDGGHDERLPGVGGGLADPDPRLLRILPLGHACHPLFSFMKCFLNYHVALVFTVL